MAGITVGSLVVVTAPRAERGVVMVALWTGSCAVVTCKSGNCRVWRCAIVTAVPSGSLRGRVTELPEDDNMVNPRFIAEIRSMIVFPHNMLSIEINVTG